MKIRRLIFVLATICTVAFSFLASAYAFNEQYNEKVSILTTENDYKNEFDSQVARVILTIPLYKDADFQSEYVLDEIKRDEIIELVESKFRNAKGEEWHKVRYNGTYEGYIPYGYIYFSANNVGYTVQVVKAKSLHVGESINVYSYYSEDSKILLSFSDGEKVNVIVEESKTYGDFSKVIILKDGKGEFGFVKTENITSGLSYNQTLALIIATGLVGLLLVGCVTAVMVMRKKRKQ